MSQAQHVSLLIATGVLGGLAGAITGVASLVVYPGLLAFGLPPVAASVTSTVANVFGGLGSSLGSGPDLVGQRDRVRRLSISAACGSLIGATVLLVTPSAVFVGVVPLLVAGASVAIVIEPSPSRRTALPADADPALLTAIGFGLGVYAGYFGAAAGTLLLGTLLLVTGETMPRAAGVKNVTFLFANLLAAVVFAIFGPVRWLIALPLCAGFLVGGRLGPPLLRRLPVRLLRPFIAACGIGLAIRLAMSAW